VATLFMCVVASRALISLLAPLLRSRRGRDMLLMGVMLAVLVPSAFRLFANDARSQDPEVVFHEIATRVRYTPFGWGGLAATQAAQGHLAAALLAILGIAAIAGVCLWVWAIAIPRAMTATDTTGQRCFRARSVFCRAIAWARSPPRRCATSFAIRAGAVP
jgi:hypothetical protein